MNVYFAGKHCNTRPLFLEYFIVNKLYFPMELTDKNYETIIKNNDKPVWIDFYSPSCGPCQMLGAFVEEKLIAYAEEKGVQVVKCNVAKNNKLATAFKVQSVPFTIAVMPDEKLLFPEIGMRDEGYYYKVIDKLAGKAKGGFFSKFFG
jgi:thioredoxin 1